MLTQPREPGVQPDRIVPAAREGRAVNNDALPAQGADGEHFDALGVRNLRVEHLAAESFGLVHAAFGDRGRRLAVDGGISPGKRDEHAHTITRERVHNFQFRPLFGLCSGISGGKIKDGRSGFRGFDKIFLSGLGHGFILMVVEVMHRDQRAQSG